MVEDTEEARQCSERYPRPLNVIEGPLMKVRFCHNSLSLSRLLKTRKEKGGTSRQRIIDDLIWVEDPPLKLTCDFCFLIGYGSGWRSVRCRKNVLTSGRKSNSTLFKKHNETD